MKSSCVRYYGTSRIHAIILTRDRSEVLKRCVETALSTLNVEDRLTVLDDSGELTFCRNHAILGDAAVRSITRMTHVRAEPFHDIIARAMTGPRAWWQTRTAPRDIAPLRNLSLLIAASVDAHTTVLLDDDICGFDLDATHRMFDLLSQAGAGLVTGAYISGISEQDTVTRLSDALHLLELKTYDSVPSVAELFRARTDRSDLLAHGFGCISAGYMAFRLPGKRLFAFPPGYNEDWLWCLLHEAVGKTRLVRLDQVVIHDPPVPRTSTHEDILFELAGDLVLQSFLECRGKKARVPDVTLKDVARHVPDLSVRPAARVKEVVEVARSLPDKWRTHALPELERHGLNILGNLLLSGELEIDASTTLSAWSCDAIAKHRSFASTLGAANAKVAVQNSLQEGEL